MNIGISGMGRMGRFHLECLMVNHPDTRVLTYWDPVFHQPINNRSAQVLPSRDWDTFCTFEGLEKVLICSPTEFHFEQITELLKRDIEIYVEPPLCRTREEANKLDALDDSLKEKLNLLPNQFDRLDFQFAYSVCRKEFFGTPVFAEISSSTTLLIGEDKKQSGVFESASLYLDQFLRLIPESPDAVYASTRDESSEDFPTEQISIELYSKNRLIGQIRINRNSAIGQSPQWKIDGIKGGYYQEKVFLKTEEEEVFSQPARKVAGELPVLNTGFREKSRDEKASDLQRSFNVIRALDAAGRSVLEKKVIPLA